MCELWQSQIYDSPSDGMTTDVLAAMNRVTLDIVGLAGEILAGPMDWHPDSDPVFFFLCILCRVWI